MASAAFEEIAENFEFLDDWEDRYRYVIELGKAMPPLEDAFPPQKLTAARHRSGWFQ
jgi:cysteine desulfuration protein SufE